jgi:hypothetical protein
MSNLRFGQEQARLLHSFIHTLKIKSGLMETREANNSESLRSLSKRIKSEQKQESMLYIATESSVFDEELDILNFTEML